MATTDSTPAATTSGRSRRLRHVAVVICVLLAVYFLVAYIGVPLIWRTFYRHHPALDDAPDVTQTKDGIPGDPLNLAIVGDEARLRAAMVAAGWHPADPLGVRSDVKIAADTVLHRSYVDAPVSNLYLFGRKEDLAFELPSGEDPRRRHHVRFWRAEKTDAAGQPLFLGAATFDRSVGLSHDTGQITHHIAPDIDTERDHVLRTLTDAGLVADTYYVAGFHKVLEGFNGERDPWHTDGRLAVAALSAAP